MKKPSQKDKILELSYTIEALEDELEDLRQDNIERRAKLWEVIQENDRLTLAYEPYRPPGDEHEGLTFYGLIEENDELTNNILDKIDVINELEEDIYHLHAKIKELEIKPSPLPSPVKMKRNPKAGCISFDFWPIRDWFRLSYYSWSPGQAAQMCIGPLRFDWFTQ